MRFLLLSLFTLLSGLGSVRSQDVSALNFTLSQAGIEAEFPNDPGYANASIPFNRRYLGIHPFAVSFPEGPHEVSIAIQAAAKEGLKVVARSGGHSYVAGGLGTTDGHFVIDLSKNKNMSYDDATGIATIQPGLRLGDVALFLNSHNRAMPHGRCSWVGVGGHSGHGGWGHHSRMWGMFLDVIKELTVVTPNGDILTASETQNADLFWALRGASSSFGVVTQLKVQTFPQPPEASIFRIDWNSLPIPNATFAISHYQNWTHTTVPSTFGGELLINKGLQQGEIKVELFGGYWGSHDSLNATLEPYLKELPTPDNISLVQGTWFEGLQNWVHLPLNTTNTSDQPDTFYAKSLLTPEDDLLTEESIENFVTYLANEGFTSNTNWFVEIELYGGNGSAINAVPHDAAAFPHRSSLFAFQLYASSIGSVPPFPDEGLTFVDGMANSIVDTEHDDWDWSSYVGYPDDRLDNWQSRYFKDHYSRLQGLKYKYDPTDILSFPLSIELGQN